MVNAFTNVQYTKQTRKRLASFSSTPLDNTLTFTKIQCAYDNYNHNHKLGNALDPRLNRKREQGY